MSASARAPFASPPRRVVVGCDGSEGARDAVALAGLLAPDDARFLLVDVAPRGVLGRRLGKHRPANFPTARQALTAGAAEGAEIATRTVRADSPAEVLSEIAGDERLDLIVVGSPHRGLLGRALLGSVAKSLLHRSPVPVAVAPRDFAAGRGLSRLVVGFDGSAEAKAALGWAEPLAASRGAELEVFTVATPPVSVPGALGYRPACVADPFDPVEEAADRAGEGARDPRPPERRPRRPEPRRRRLRRRPPHRRHPIPRRHRRGTDRFRRRRAGDLTEVPDRGGAMARPRGIGRAGAR